MAQQAPVITFDGKQQQYLKLVAPYAVLKQVAANVTGVNLSSDKRYIRTAREEMSCYYIMQYSGYQPDQEVLDWLYECKRLREQLSTIFANAETGFKLSTGYEGWLHKFQTCDVKFMVMAKRCINANEVGVGKTVEAIAACDEVGASRVLVVCPKSLMYMWQDEFRERSYGDVSVCTERSSYKRREKIQAKIDANARVYVINYAMLDQEKWPELFERDYDVIICDEAHKLKNPDTKTAKNFQKLNTEYMWLLTGTPDPNGDVGEIFGMLHALYPEQYTSYWAFVERFGEVVEDVIYTRGKEIKRKNLLGLKEEAKPVLHRLLVPRMIRRTKKDVGYQLPETIYKTINVELSEYERKLYDDLFREMIAKLDAENWLIARNTLERDVRLRLMLLNPVLVGGKDESAKTDALFELIEGIPGQIIVFTNYKQYTRYLEQRFASLQLSALRIDGDIDAETIRANEKAFQQGRAKIIYGTIAKMGEGLNLQNAQALIFMDKSYVPKDNIQAEGRIIRPGLKTNPLIVDIQAKNTIDQIIAEVNRQKQHNINEIEAFKYMVDQLKNIYV